MVFIRKRISREGKLGTTKQLQMIKLNTTLESTSKAKVIKLFR